MSAPDRTPSTTDFHCAAGAVHTCPEAVGRAAPVDLQSAILDASSSRRRDKAANFAEKAAYYWPTIYILSCQDSINRDGLPILLNFNQPLVLDEACLYWDAVFFRTTLKAEAVRKRPIPVRKWIESGMS
jgi:hypothetical protein